VAVIPTVVDRLTSTLQKEVRMRIAVCILACFVLFTAPVFAQEQITNEGVIKMVKAGLAEAVIIQAVQQQPAKFSVSPDDLISLKSAGVPDNVISAMLLKAKSGSVPPEATPPASTQGTERARRSNIIQVMYFDQKPGAKMPEDTLKSLMGSIMSELTSTGRFDRVVGDADKLQDGQAGLRLTGTVVEFKKGSRATRYMLGPASLAGPGKTVVKANVQLIDVPSGRVLHQQNVDGRVWIGLFGGSSDGAKQGIAKEIAKVVTSKAF
jgi:hypothetical protein